MGKKMAKDRTEMAQSRAAIIERSDGMCEARWSPLCTGRGEHAHHKLRKSQGGTNDPGNLLWTCAPCHRRIHDMPAESVVRGFLIPRSAA